MCPFLNLELLIGVVPPHRIGGSHDHVLLLSIEKEAREVGGRSSHMVCSIIAEDVVLFLGLNFVFFLSWVGHYVKAPAMSGAQLEFLTRTKRKSRHHDH